MCLHFRQLPDIRDGGGWCRGKLLIWALHFIFHLTFCTASWLKASDIDALTKYWFLFLIPTSHLHSNSNKNCIKIAGIDWSLEVFSFAHSWPIWTWRTECWTERASRWTLEYDKLLQWPKAQWKLFTLEWIYWAVVGESKVRTRIACLGGQVVQEQTTYSNYNIHMSRQSFPISNNFSI